MYFEHWSLDRPPFQAQPDSRFLFATERHDRALATINYAAREGGEPVLLTGETGCGKTLLLRALRRQLPREQFHVAFVPEVACSQVGLLRRVTYHLSHKLVADAAAAMDAVLHAAADAEHADRGIVLMLDDWPAIPDDALHDELRWLLNIDVEGSPLRILLAGDGMQPASQWPGWLVQRLLTTVALGPLPLDGVAAYLDHRLRVAGRETRETFTAEAAAAIAEWSGAVPRLVNRVAHLALHVAYLDLATRVELDAVDRAIERLGPAPIGEQVGAEA